MAWHDKPCLIWSGYINEDGYGVAPRRIDGKRKKAHVAAWIEAYGPVPDGLEVCHHCDERACHEVTHLWVGTHAENVADMIAKGRGREQKKTACPRGHAYNDVRPNGWRRCTVCENERKRKLRSAGRPA